MRLMVTLYHEETGQHGIADHTCDSLVGLEEHFEEQGCQINGVVEVLPGIDYDKEAYGMGLYSFPVMPLKSSRVLTPAEN